MYRREAHGIGVSLMAMSNPAVALAHVPLA
jgi:hypothetical protein